MLKTSPALEEVAGRIHSLKTLIGNTPLLELDFRFRGDRRRMFAKAENLNMTGSIKDRMALFILERAVHKRLFKPGDIIVEATSGNTGISFSAIGRSLGHRVKIYMPDWMSEERVALITSLGAEIEMVSEGEGGFLGSIERAEELGKRDDVFLPRQFANEDNVAAHAAGTGPEIWAQLASRELTPDAFVAGVGTGGTVMGVCEYFRTQSGTVRVHPLEPASSPTLSAGHRVGRHRIQGISDEFVPPIVDLNALDSVIAVDDGDAIIMAQKLARESGLGVGISSGANFLGALAIQNDLGADSVVVTVFPDSNKKYLSTDLLHEEPVKLGFLSTDVQLQGMRVVGRACRFCMSPVLDKQSS